MYMYIYQGGGILPKVNFGMKISSRNSHQTFPDCFEEKKTTKFFRHEICQNLQRLRWGKKTQKFSGSKLRKFLLLVFFFYFVKSFEGQAEFFIFNVGHPKSLIHSAIYLTDGSFLAISGSAEATFAGISPQPNTWCAGGLFLYEI